MYKIKFWPRKNKGIFTKIVKKTTDKNGNCPLLNTLQNFPKGNTTTHNLIARKGKYWSYDITKGDRITYKVYDKEKIVIVYFIGNHNDYMKFLKK